LSEPTPAPACVNLLATFGEEYRVTWDESREGRDESPWLMQVPCRYGTIYPQGGDLLAVEVDGHGKLAARLGRGLGLKIHQGDDGKPATDPRKDWSGDMTFLFPVARFAEVAEVVQPRRRPRPSPAQLANLTAEGREQGLRKLAEGRRR
jgi:hypothetical protein